MTTIVPVLPCRVLTIPLNLPMWHPQVDFLVDAAVRKMIRHHLIPALREHGYTVDHEEHVFTSVMIRLYPDEDTPTARLEVIHPHPGRAHQDPYDRTPHWETKAELVGGPEDGRIITMANTSPEHWVVIPEITPHSAADWGTGRTYPTAMDTTPTLRYTRTGVDLATGHWRYQLGGRP